MDQAYQNKVVVITGGSRGIGAALVEGYLAQGAQVVVFDVVRCSNGKATFIEVDLANENAIETAFDQVMAKFGTVHVLINNGAIAYFHKSIFDIRLEEFKKLIDVNLNGAFACCQQFVRANAGQNYGRIVNIASTRWGQNEADWDAYGASKGGLVALTQSLCVSLSEMPITVNCISPGWIETGDYSALSEKDHRQHPSGRVGKPQDMVSACLFFTAPDNDFVNGCNLLVDGGMSKKMIYL